MQIITKVLNSNAVLVRDERGMERVLIGKAIGYGRKRGTEVPPDAADQEFLALPDADHRHLVELMGAIDPDFVSLTREIVRQAQAAGLDLDPHIYLTLTDHMNFAVASAKAGRPNLNRLTWEMQTIYPRHYALARRTVAFLRRRWRVELPEDEAAAIAFHLVNADSTQAASDSMRVAELVRSVVTIVSNAAGLNLREGDLHYARFVTHLQYFAERFYAGALLDTRESLLYRTLREQAPRAVETGERVREFMLAAHRAEIPDEEIAYLALHIARAAEATT